MRVLTTRVCHVVGRVVCFLDAWNDLTADRAVGVVPLDQIEIMRRYGEGQLGPG